MLRRTLTTLALVLLGSGATHNLAAGDPPRTPLGQVWGVAYSPDGLTLATACGNEKEPGALALWDAPTGKVRRWLKHPLGVRCVAFSPNGEKVATGGMDKQVRIYEVRTGKMLAAMKGHTALVNSVAFSPDGKRLASCSLDNTIFLWDVEKGAESGQLLGHEDWVLSVAFFPDGKSLVSVSKDATARVWDLEAGKERLVLKQPGGPGLALESVAVSPDGKTIATGGWDTVIRLWDADKGEMQSTLRGHGMGVLSLTYSPDGKTLASVSGIYGKQVPGEIKLWSLPVGEERASLTGHADSIWSVRFAPDGRTLATAGWDQKVKVWEVATGQERLTLDDGAAALDGKRPEALTEKELDEIWKSLAAADGASAQRALGRLARAPEQATSLFSERLKPAPKAAEGDEKRAREWVAKLDDDDFDTREKATTELAKLGAVARPALQKALDDASSAEARQRIAGLIDKLGKFTDPEQLRGLRALEVLEWVHTAEARKLLEKLAEGAPDAAFTREAAASCRRLKNTVGPAKVEGVAPK